MAEFFFKFGNVFRIADNLRHFLSQAMIYSEPFQF